MRNSMSLFTILTIILFLQHQAVVNSLSPKMQKLALFQFKLSLKVNLSSSEYCYSSYPKTMNWSLTSDCCTWDGVTCEQNTGDVIGLDLSCSQLEGAILPNSTLFHLSRLQSLNLAHNDFSLSDHFPQNFVFFAPGLTHLNLSYTKFSDVNASGISNLYKLVSLDLSDSGLKLEHHSLELLLQNLTHLRILDLENLDIYSVLPMNLSTSLTHLKIAFTGLHGVIPEEVFHLPNLEVLDLSYNVNLTGNLPKVKWGSSSTLQMLDLGRTGLSGEIPDSIAYLKSLNILYLSDNNLSGPFPSWVVNLRQLRSLDLSYNSLTGPLPSNLTALCLSELQDLRLGQNSLNGTIPSWLFDLPSLTSLVLDSNRFTGKLNEFTSSKSKLTYISFRYNLLYGTIPQSFSHLMNLTHLDLSSNNFSGVLDIDMFFRLDYLERLYFSHNSLSLRINSTATIAPRHLTFLGLSSCNIKEFPHFLRATREIDYIDLSNNQIDGEIPHWIGKIGLGYLNLSHNSLTGGFEYLPWNSLHFLDLQHNMLNGSLPASICKAYYLFVLNLSHNKLSGVLPTCTENLTSLLVFDLRMNNIQGHLPSTLSNFRGLESLNLHGNNLEGTIPPSFAEFDRLEVLDLGSNQIKDTFPQHLEALPNLQVLTLKSNHLHGPISNNSKIGHPFASLRIIDLSCNDFSGPLPARYIKNFKAMMNGTDVNKTERLYMEYSSFYRDSTTMVIKGVETEFFRILTILTAIDLSKNKFEGEIPEFIGNLVLLRYLNLSHNHLTGHIPSSIRKMSVLESLDLSFNGLEGEIPQELTSMTFLSHLNLSENKLRGHIPQGNEFDTYENDSYIGNLGLCGRPLSKECGRDKTEGGEEGEDDDSGFTWEAVVIGYGSGAVIGFSMGCLMFSVGKPKCHLFCIVLNLVTKF